MTSRGDIAIFFTGGTILMRPRPEGRGVAPSENFDQLLGELDLRVQGVGFRPIYWGNRPSPHMTPKLMFRLARDVDETLADPSVLGAVVLHGTDVLIESAYMADLAVESTKPVVFTGSMRFYSELGYDGIRNLLGGIKACLLPIPPEVGVVLLMTDRLFTAREVAKINSLNIDAFEAPEAGPVGYVAGDTVMLTRLPSAHRVPVKARTIEPNVALISCYTGMDGDLVDHLMKRGTAGLVVEGFGAGNVPPQMVPSLEAMVRANVPVVLTTRCIEGGVWPMYGYPGGGADLDGKGIILAGRLSGPKARLLLMAALGKTRDMDEIKRIFQGDYF